MKARHLPWLLLILFLHATWCMATTNREEGGGHQLQKLLQSQQVPGHNAGLKLHEGKSTIEEKEGLDARRKMMNHAKKGSTGGGSIGGRRGGRTAGRGNSRRRRPWSQRSGGSSSILVLDSSLFYTKAVFIQVGTYFLSFFLLFL